MENDLQRWYSGYLSLAPDGVERRNRLSAATTGVAGFDLTDRTIELEYKGRDTSRAIVRVLVEIARVVGEAEGEIVCQISGDGTETQFEFYTIRDGRLFQQRAKIIREPARLVTLDPM